MIKHVLLIVTEMMCVSCCMQVQGTFQSNLSTFQSDFTLKFRGGQLAHELPTKITRYTVITVTPTFAYMTNCTNLFHCILSDCDHTNIMFLLLKCHIVTIATHIFSNCTVVKLIEGQWRIDILVGMFLLH